MVHTPLHYACRRGSFEIIKILADHPQCNTTETKNEKESRPLHETCESGNADIVRYLVNEKVAMYTLKIRMMLLH